MAKNGKNGTKTYSFKLNTKDDANLIVWLMRQDNQSEAIRQALHVAAGNGVGGHGNAEVLRAIARLEKKLDNMTIVSPGNKENEEPPEAAAALDALAELGGS